MGLFLTAKGRVQWTASQVEKEKAAIRGELKTLDSLPPKKKLQEILTRIRETEQDNSSEQRLRCFIYIISALVHHQKHSVLSPTQIEGLVSSAYAILQTNAIKPGTSRLAFLYGELHQVTSLIYRKEGKLWRSAWEQQLSLYVSKPVPIGGEGFQALALGNRALRLGNAAMAYKEFQTAEQDADLSLSQKGHARIGRVRALRLAGLLEAAEALIYQTVEARSLPSAFTKELEWELLCVRDLTKAGNFLAMVQAVKKGGTHCQASYIVESFLWAASCQTTEWMKRLSKMRTVARNKALKVKGLGFFFEAALVIEDCYDKDIPLILRLKKLGNVLAKASALLNIDKEALLWAAAARWLARIHSFPLSIHALKQYESIALRLSDGKTPDTLGLVTDLMASSWFKELNWEDVMKAKQEGGDESSNLPDSSSLDLDSTA